MNLSACVKHFQEKDLIIRGRLIYGIYADYPLFLQLPGSGETVGSIILRIQLQDTMDKKLRKEFKNLLKKRSQIVFTGHTLQITIRTPKDESLTECDDIMNTVIEFLSNNGLTVSDTCPICGQPVCDSAVFYNGAFQKVHANCITAAMDHLAQKAENNRNNGNYALGILGAILGGIVGILPSVLTIWFTETIYVILYALIPICIYWGYRLFRGIINKGAIIITIVLSVFFLFFMEFILLVMSVYHVYGLLLVKECLEMFFQPDIFSEIFSDMTSSFIFLALGIFYSWRMISETNTGISSSIEFTLSTLTPLYKPAPADPVAESVSDSIPVSSADTMESTMM